jgi:hypothetical protein
LISAYVAGKTIQQAEADKEAASTPAVQRKVVASAVFDYVQDRFKDLRTQAESGGEGARRAQRTLDVFGKSFFDITAPVTEGTRDARIEAFSASPQGRALITDAFDNLSGLGYFNRPKFKAIVDLTSNILLVKINKKSDLVQLLMLQMIYQTKPFKP